jgi:hypothetical protein
MTKPVVAYVAGLSAPKGRKMGHAGAIISAFGESAQEKVDRRPRPRRLSATRSHKFHLELAVLRDGLFLREFDTLESRKHHTLNATKKPREATVRIRLAPPRGAMVCRRHAAFKSCRVPKD